MSQSPKAFVGLKSNAREVKPKRFLGFDTEDDSKGNLLQVCVTDGERFHHFTKRERFIKWLYETIDETTYLVAVNLEYDLINIFAERLDLLTLRLKNGGLSLVSARLNGTRLTFYDTLNHFPAGAAALGDAIGLPKLKMDLTGWDYVERDTLIAQRYTVKMQEAYNRLGANFNATLPSSALDLYRRHYLPFAIRKPADTTLELMFQGYYGGRVEVFNTAPQSGRIFYIDVNSMYPYVMQREYPNPNVYRFRNGKPNISGYGVACVNVTLPRKLRFPPLAHRTDKLIFPVGRFSGVWTFAEIAYALERGAKVNDWKWYIDFPDTCFPFKRYVRDLYEVKRNAPNELERNAAKLFLNSLYGKMGERVELVTVCPVEQVPEDKTAIAYGDYAFVSHGAKYPNHTNAIWAIYTTAYARLLLCETLEHIDANGGTVLYCDTDSIIYKARKPLHHASDSIGDWKLEGEFDFAHFLAPKLYALEKNGERKIRAKGVPRDFAYRFFDEGRAEFSRPLRLRTVLRRGLPGNLWVTATKERRAGYSKRRVHADGTTEPLYIRG